MKKKAKWILISIFTLCIAGYGVYEGLKPLQTELLEVVPGDVTISFKEKGTVKSAESVKVYSELALKVIQVPVEEGRPVKKGDILLTLDKKALELELESVGAQKSSIASMKEKAFKDLQNEITRQELQKEESQRRLESLLKDYNRAKELYLADSISQSDFEAVEELVKQAENALSMNDKLLEQLKEQFDNKSSETGKYYNTQIAAYDAAQEKLKYQIEKCTVKAPIDGIISTLDVRPGMIVSPQMPICTIIQPDNKKLEVHVLTGDVADIRTGMKVKLLQEGKINDIEMDGVVDFIAPNAEESISSLGLKEKRIRVDIVSEKLNELYEGSSVDASFITYMEKDRLLVPKTSVFKYNDKDMVWVVRDGIAKRQEITRGIETDIDVVVLEGLSSGDLVIKNPNMDGLSGGKRVVGK